MTVKHTPGPFLVRDRFYICKEGDPFSLASVSSCQTVPADRHEEHEANAHLFAAADRLLAACHAVVAYSRLTANCSLCGYLYGQHDADCPVPVCCAAIAAAEEVPA